MKLNGKGSIVATLVDALKIVAMEKRYMIKNLTQKWPDLIAVLFLALLPLALYGDVLLSSDRLIYSLDIDYFYPHELVLETAGYGESFPLWNPYFGAGFPGLGKIQTGFFYLPLVFLRLLLSVETALDLDPILHLFIAGTGVYFLMRQLSVSRIPALFAAVAFMFSGSFTPRIFAGHASVIRTIAWSGWLVLAYIRLLQRRGWQNAVWAAVVIGLVILGGHPQMTLTVLLIPFGYFIGVFAPKHIWEKQWLTVLSGLWWSAGAVILAAGLTAVQIIPYLAWQRSTVRAAGNAFDSLEAVVSHSFAWHQFFQLVMPTLWFDPESKVGFQVGNLAYFWESSAFTGLLTIFIVVIGIALPSTKNRANRRFFAGCALIGLIFSMGTINPFYNYLFETMPYIRAPGRFMLWWTLALAILAGMALDILSKNPSLYIKLFNRAGPIGFGGGLLIAASLFLMGVFHGYFIIPQNDIWPLEQSATSIAQLGVKLLVIATLLWIMRKWKQVASYAGILLLLFLVVEMSMFTIALKYPTPLSTVYKSESPYTQLNLSVDKHRFDNWRYPPLYLLPTLTHVENGEERSKLENLLKTANGLNLLAANLKMTQQNVDDPEWQLAQNQNGWNLYTNHRNLPRIYAAPDVREVANEDEALLIVGNTSFSGWEEAIIFSPTVVEQEVRQRLSAKSSNADGEMIFVGHYLSYENNQLVAEVVTNQPVMVVFSEMYDEGWRATVNGETAPLWLVNYAFRGVVVEEGVSIIMMEYHSRSYSLGLGISLLTLLIILAIVGNSYIRTSKHE